MTRVKLAANATTLLLVVIVLGGCSAADDATRFALRNADEASRVRQLGDDVLRLGLRTDEAVIGRAVDRVDGIAGRFALTKEAEDALRGLAWTVGCDVVAGNVPRTEAEVQHRLLTLAAQLGLQFFDDAEQLVGGAILASLDTAEESNDAAEACAHIRDSGL